MESPSANSQKHKKLPTEAAIYSIQELSIILKMDKEPMFSITPSSIKKKYDNTAATNQENGSISKANASPRYSVTSTWNLRAIYNIPAKNQKGIS